MGDAEYMDFNGTDTAYNDGEGGIDFELGVDELNVGMGAGPVGGGYGHRLHWWGAFRNDPSYHMLYQGTGKPLSLVYWDSKYGDNSKTDTLVFNLFPVP